VAILNLGEYRLADYRLKRGLGLETPNNRIDTGDLKIIILALYEIGFDVLARNKKFLIIKLWKTSQIKT